MKNPICFNFLKNYIRNLESEDYCSLFFYLDLNYYKNNILHFTNENKVEYANKIFYEYISSSNTRITRNAQVMTKSYYSDGMSSGYKFSSMDFPIDIQEKIEDAAKENFEIQESNLDDLFDEAFSHINNKLYNKYLMMIRDQDEYRKLEKLICYFDFDFSDLESCKFYKSASNLSMKY